MGILMIFKIIILISDFVLYVSKKTTKLTFTRPSVSLSSSYLLLNHHNGCHNKQELSDNIEIALVAFNFSKNSLS